LHISPALKIEGFSTLSSEPTHFAENYDLQANHTHPLMPVMTMNCSIIRALLAKVQTNSPATRRITNGPVSGT
jgi:hypothetical protein